MKRRAFMKMATGAAMASPALATAQTSLGGVGVAPDGGAPLWSWDATDLAAAIRGGEITSREATQSALERIDAVDGALNAVADVLRDEALAAADAADEAVARGEALGPLHGVPVTIKINVDMAGHATTNGVVANRDKIVEEDSSPVRNWKKAGAVIVGRTNTPAMSFRWFTENDLHGRTLNPWSREVTPGGSSGGAASAVAAGMGALAHGTDIAGSVRYPGYACGVPAIRPSLGRLPNRSPGGGAITRQLMAVHGVLGRSVGDVRIGLEAMAAPDPGDPWYAPAPLTFPASADDRTVLLFREAEGYRPDASVASALDAAARALADAGYAVEERALPHFAEAQDLWSALVMNENRRSFEAAVPAVGDVHLERFVEAWLEVIPEADLDDFSAALSRRSVIAGEWDLLFEDHAAILMPNSWEAPFRWDRDQGGPEAVRDLLHVQSPMLAPALLGLPGLSVPTGLVEGIPAGVQIVARRFREDRCFELGQVIEAGLGRLAPVDPRV